VALLSSHSSHQAQELEILDTLEEGSATMWAAETGATEVKKNNFHGAMERSIHI